MDVVSDAISAVRIGRPSSQRVRIAGSWCTRLAPYDGAGFHVVLEGHCWLLPDGGEPVELGPGDAVLLPHGTGHVIADRPADAARLARAVPFERWQAGTGAGPRRPEPPAAPEDGTAVEMLCGKYRLDRSHVHPLLAELPPLVHLPHRAAHPGGATGTGGTPGTDPGLRSAIALLGHEVGERLPGSGVALTSLLDLLLVYMIRSWTAENAAPDSRDGAAGTGGTAGTAGSWPAALGDPVTAAALRALHTDPAAPWTIELLAAEAGVSRPTLARRFTALVGRPPMAYLTWWRLTRAAALLRDTPDPLAAVARRVGYSTPYALSHAFRREFGTTPGQYRAGLAAATAG
ncbi:AraC family transcriptional regulator [Streptomyces sp. TX20-6-3]|uniref:AraC family transcriptional regulator n=1 Tax=Streptomyces sp. TX20-6-3 TaxID=3028705 RepID=UPI0029B3DF9E|nr:AraC family transcriptional regulator [Streptomyces sp. TX20-6-3]MDX2560313.1 AraC family transcriptional regulator [Streptomyces sp. TX20-6-3]